MTCTQDSFLRDVENHVMTIKAENGLYRHIRFRREKENAYWFDIITWPGVLTISGDYGTYVFSRIEDMFEFFRVEPKRTKPGEIHINKGYWAEKLLAQDCNGRHTNSVKRPSSELFETRVKEWFDDHYQSDVEGDTETLGYMFDGSEEIDTQEIDAILERIEKREAVWDEIESQVLLYNNDGEHEAFRAARAFESYEDPNFNFDDFWEVDCTEWSFHFVWCLYAIAWGIAKYDEAKKQAEAQPEQCRELHGSIFGVPEYDPEERGLKE